MSVNVENINRMIAAIEAQVEPIHMSDFVVKNGSENECGTTACLAGWANLLRLEAVGNGETEISNRNFGSIDTAAKWMGINEYTAQALFFHGAVDYLKPEFRKEAAIKLLTELRDTNGRARWSEVMADYRDEDGTIKPEFRRRF